jgi:hypothetical protein
MTGAWTLGEVFVLRHAGFPFDWVERLGISNAFRETVSELLAAEKAGLATPEQRRAALALYALERARLGECLQKLAREPKVQEAVFLSSPDVFENVWARYAQQPLAAENAKTRRTERLVYSYLQRLCAKNETTSFFGPMGYGEIEGPDDAIELLPAQPQNRTNIAYWAVEALARQVASEPEIWHALPIRQSPLFRVTEDSREARCDSLERVEALSDEQARLLRVLSECQQIGELSRKLQLDQASVLRLMMPLLEAGVLVRRIWFPSDAADTLSHLRLALEALPASKARDRWLVSLATLDALCRQFEDASFEQRRVLLNEMELFFTKLTRTAARRAGGRLYTDRLIINEESSSPFRLRIGQKAARALEDALSPLLEISAAYGERMQRSCADAVCDQLGTQHGSTPFLAYAAALREMQVAPPRLPPITTDEPGPVQLRADVCGVASEGSRFALPDVCLTQRPDGSFRPVLARVHHHLLTRGWLLDFYPDQVRADRVAGNWLAQGRAAFDFVELASGRHNKGYYTFPGARAVHASAELIERTHTAYAAAELSVTVTSEQITLHGPTGAPLTLYLPLADLTLHPPFIALSHPPVVHAPIRSRETHCPRLDLGEATYQRERWETTLDGWGKLSGFALFVELQRRKAELGLPRFFFARVSGERKPFLVDTDCPFAVELLRHFVRSAPDVTFEEMLPAPEDLWLRDVRGRYTCEIRAQFTRN